MLPENWVTNKYPEVLKYLNKKYNRNLIGLFFYYGETNAQEYFEGDYYPKNYTYLTKEQFLEMTTEQEVWKKGDIIYSEKHNTYRKIHSCIDDIVFTTNSKEEISEIYENSVTINIKNSLIDNGYKLYNSKNSNVLELTLGEIAEKFNVDVKDLKIKK